MKKIILILALVFLAADFSYGQFALGAKVGYNASKLTTNIEEIKSEFNSGFHVGAWARFGKKLYLSPEFVYSMSGGVFKADASAGTSGWEQKVTVGSIDIPLLLGFKIIHSDLITWRIEAGPQISMAVNKKVKDMHGPLGPITPDDIQSASWYVQAGTGIDVLFLRFDVRYQYGLTDLITDVGNMELNSSSSVLILSAGIKIFGRK